MKSADSEISEERFVEGEINWIDLFFQNVKKFVSKRVLRRVEDQLEEAEIKERLELIGFLRLEFSDEMFLQDL